MYKDDLQAAHERIRVLEKQLNKQPHVIKKTFKWLYLNRESILTNLTVCTVGIVFTWLLYNIDCGCGDETRAVEIVKATLHKEYPNQKLLIKCKYTNSPCYYSCRAYKRNNVKEITIHKDMCITREDIREYKKKN